VDLIYPARLVAVFRTHGLLVSVQYRYVQIDTFHYSACRLSIFSSHAGLAINAWKEISGLATEQLDFVDVTMTVNLKVDFRHFPVVTKTLCLFSELGYQATY